MPNPLYPLGHVIGGQTRLGDGSSTLLHPLTNAIPVTYTISSSQYAAVATVSYTTMAANVQSCRVYYTVSAQPFFAINGDASIVAPDQVVYTPRPVSGRTLVGTPQLQGYITMTWQWSVMMVEEWSKIIQYYNPFNPTVFITYPDDNGQWVQRQATLHPPTYGTQSTISVSGASLNFTHL